MLLLLFVPRTYCQLMSYCPIVIGEVVVLPKCWCVGLAGVGAVVLKKLLMLMCAWSVSFS